LHIGNLQVKKMSDYSQHTILIVEDNEVYRQFLTTLIKKFFKAEVVGTSNPKVAFEWLQTNKPLFIILDLELPVMDGYTFLKKIRNDATTSSTSVVICSALNTRDLLKSLVNQKIVDFIDKRSEASNVATRIKKVFELLS